MNVENMGFWAVWAVLGLCMIIYYMRCKRRIRAVLWSVLSGTGSLLLLNFFGSGLGIAPPVNLFNLIQSWLLGIPGVVLMAVMTAL